MAWTIRFSGLPTLTSLPTAGDSYAAGVFSISSDPTPRDLENSTSSTAPLAYVSMAGLPASPGSVLRVTARMSALAGVAYTDLGGGVFLWGRNLSDQARSFGYLNSPGPTNGVFFGNVTENGTNNSLGTVPDGSAGPVPWQFRIYWNGTDSAFIIPDAGFGSHSVAAKTQSIWYSKDDGTTWTRFTTPGDRAIAAGVFPERIGIFAHNQAPSGLGDEQVTFTNLELAEENITTVTTTGTGYACTRNPGPFEVRSRPPAGPWNLELTPPTDRAPHAINGLDDGTLWLAMIAFFTVDEVWRKLPSGSWTQLATRAVSFNCVSPVSQTECWFTDGHILVDRYIHGSGFFTWNMEAQGFGLPVVEFRQTLIHAYSSTDVLAIGIDGSSKIHFARWDGVSWSIETTINHSHGNILGAMAVAGNNVYFAVGDGGTGNKARLYRHTNKGIGSGWTEIGAAGTGWITSIAVPSGIWVNPADTNEIWVTFETESGGADVFRSTDGGANWTSYTRNPGTGTTSIASDGQGNIWIGHNQQHVLSVFNGTDWTLEILDSGGLVGWIFPFGGGGDQGYQRLFMQNPDTDPPDLSNQTPPPSSKVGKSTNITLDITDSQTGVDVNSVILRVNGTIAWQSDTQQAGFSVTKTPITQGFRYEINPDSNFTAPSTVTVRVQADDQASTPNSLDESYTFDIGAQPGKLYVGGREFVSGSWRATTFAKTEVGGFVTEHNQLITTDREFSSVRKRSATEWAAVGGRDWFTYTSGPALATGDGLAWSDITPPNGVHEYYDVFVRSDGKLWLCVREQFVGGVHGVWEYDPVTTSYTKILNTGSWAPVSIGGTDDNNVWVISELNGTWQYDGSWNYRGVPEGSTTGYTITGIAGGEAIATWTFGTNTRIGKWTSGGGWAILTSISVSATEYHPFGAHVVSDMDVWVTFRDGTVRQWTSGGGWSTKFSAGGGRWAYDVVVDPVSEYVFACGITLGGNQYGWYAESYDLGANWNLVLSPNTWSHTRSVALATDLTAPTIQNRDPAPGEEGVAVDTTITLEIVDLAGSGVDASTVVLTVEGSVAWTGGAAQPGFSVTETPITDGFRYEIDQTANFPYLELVSVRVEADDLAANSIDETYTFRTAQRIISRRTTITVLANQLMRVFFSQPVAINDALQLTSNYVPTPITAGADSITVEEIRGVKWDEESETSFVDVRISKPTLDAVYELEVNNITTKTNVALTDQVARWKAKKTKVDSMLQSTARMYSRDFDSNIAHVFLAMALEDERVGGQGDIAVLPPDPSTLVGPPDTPDQTYGSATYGTSTFGG